MGYCLDFEKPVFEIEKQIEEIRSLYNTKGGEDLLLELKRLEKLILKLRKSIFNKLTPWQKTLIARHPDRPYTLDFIRLLLTDFIELHGDRRYADDPAIVAGFGWFNAVPIALIGHQKGRDTRDRVQRNFGQPHPEGYRKALRVMKLAEKFSIPVVTFIDTPGAYPGIGAEERGQGEAIALNLEEMARLKTPIISIIIGEGGSGGALALAVADRVMMLEHAIYSVISPEGCAAILWKKSEANIGQEEYEKASEALKLTAQDLIKFGVIHQIISEPLGGAHKDHKKIANNIKHAINKQLSELIHKPIDALLKERYDNFRQLGQVRRRAPETVEIVEDVQG